MYASASVNVNIYNIYIYVCVTSHVRFYPMSGKIKYAINHVGNCITIYHVDT